MLYRIGDSNYNFIIKFKGVLLYEECSCNTGWRKTQRKYRTVSWEFRKRSNGHQAEIVSLIKNEVKGCLGYNACRYGKPCIQKDGFNGLVPKIKEADLIVFASPLYFGQYRQELRHLLRGFTVLRKKMEIRLSDAMRNIPSKTVRFWWQPPIISSGHLSRLFRIISLRLSIISASMTRGCSLPVRWMRRYKWKTPNRTDHVFAGGIRIWKKYLFRIRHFYTSTYQTECAHFPVGVFFCQKRRILNV